MKTGPGPTEVGGTGHVGFSVARRAHERKAGLPTAGIEGRGVVASGGSLAGRLGLLRAVHVDSAARLGGTARAEAQ